MTFKIPRDTIPFIVQERCNSTSKSTAAVARLGGGIFVPVGEQPLVRVWNLVTREFGPEFWKPNRRRVMSDRQQSNHLGDPQIEQGPRTIDFREVKGMTLKPGDAIVGVETLSQLDGLLDTIAVNLTGIALKGEVGQRTTPLEVTPLSESFKSDGAKVRCFGAIRDFWVWISPIQPDKGLTLQVTGTLSSAKKRDFSPICREVTISVARSGNPRLDSRLVNEQELRGNARGLSGSGLAAVDPGYNDNRAGPRRAR